MQKRIIIQGFFARDGLVINVQETLSADELKLAILRAIPVEHVSAELEIFDEADATERTEALLTGTGSLSTW